MRKLFILALLALALASCEKFGDVNTALKGKTFEYWNGETGSMEISKTYTFGNDGNVFYESRVGLMSPFNTSGCDLYYKMDGNSFTIYHGVKGWKKEVRHTVFSSGEYFGDYITVDGDRYDEI